MIQKRVLSLLLAISMLLGFFPVSGFAGDDSPSMEMLGAGEPLKILTIGNSFSRDSMFYLSDLAGRMGKNVSCGYLYIGSCTLQMHAQNAANDAAAYVYYKNSTDSILWTEQGGVKMSEALADQDWDIIVLQNGVVHSARSDTYNPYLEQLIDYVQEKCPGVPLYWNMTWANQTGHNYADFNTYFSGNQTAMFNAIAGCMNNIILENDHIVQIIPTGAALQKVRATSLGDTVTRDGYHLSTRLGRLTAGLTWLKILYPDIDLQDVNSTMLDGILFDEYAPSLLDPYVNSEANLALIRSAVESAVAEVTVLPESERQVQPALPVSTVPAPPSQPAGNEDNLLEPDVIIAQANPPYYHFFADIVNVPAHVYGGDAPNGKLIVPFFRNTVHSSPDERFPLGEIWMTESEDNGETWSSYRRILSYEKLLEYGIGTPQEPVECRDPNLAILPDGTVLLTFFTRRYATDRFLRTYITESKDGGETWSAPQEVVSNELDAWLAKRGNIAVLSNEEILVPVYGGSLENTSSSVRVIRGVRGAGGLWDWTEEITIDPNVHAGQAALSMSEVSLVYMEDGDGINTGTVYAMARPGGQVLVSRERGRDGTWELLGIETPMSQPGFIRLPDGRVFGTWSRPSTPRFIYGKMFYFDDVFGWQSTSGKVLYTGGDSSRDMADPSAVLTNDGRLLVLYYDTNLRAIAGTFSQLSDWDFPDILEGTAHTEVLAEDFEACTPDAAYDGGLFTASGVATQAADGNQFASLSGGGSLVSIAPIWDDCSLELDFRFADVQVGEVPALSVSLTEGSGTALRVVVTPEELQLTRNGEVLRRAQKSLVPGDWYTIRIMQTGEQLYAKVAPKGHIAAANWAYAYSHTEVLSKRKNLAISLAAGDFSVELDNLSVLSSYTIGIEQTELNVYAGDEDIQLNLYYYPSQNGNPPVQWSSSNPSVASVDAGGKVSFHSPGGAVITATAGASSDSCAVTVKALPGEITGEGAPYPLFREEFTDKTPDQPYSGTPLVIAGDESNSSIVKVEGDNRYLQLSSENNSLAQDFESTNIGSLPAGITGRQSSVQQEPGTDNKVLQVADNDSGNPADAVYKTGKQLLPSMSVEFKLNLRKVNGTAKMATVKVFSGLEKATDTPADANVEYWIRFTPDGKIEYYQAVGGYKQISTPLKISTEQWHTIRIQFRTDKPDTPEAQLYIDGVLAGSVPKYGGASAGPGYCGASFLSNGKGPVDELFFIDDLYMGDATPAVALHTFEGTAVGSLPSGFTAAKQATVQYESGTSGNKVLAVNDTSASSIAEVTYATGLPVNQRVDIDFKVYVKNLKTTNNMALKILTDSHSFPNTAFWIRFTTGGGFAYNNGGSYINVSTTPHIYAEQWHSVHIECYNTSAQDGEAHIYIDGKFAGIQEVLRAGGRQGHEHRKRRQRRPLPVKRLQLRGRMLLYRRPPDGPSGHDEGKRRLSARRQRGLHRTVRLPFPHG